MASVNENPIENLPIEERPEYFGIHYRSKRTGENYINPCFQTFAKAYEQFAIIHKSADYTYWVGPSAESGKDQSIYMKLSNRVYESKNPLEDLKKYLYALEILEQLEQLEMAMTTIIKRYIQ